MVATNTLKRQAVDNKTPLGVWLGDASCGPVSCGVPPDVEHTLHGSVAQHFPNAALYTCASGYSLDGLRTKGVSLKECAHPRGHPENLPLKCSQRVHMRCSMSFVAKKDTVTFN